MRHFILAAFCASILLQVTAQKTNRAQTSTNLESESSLNFSSHSENESFNYGRKYEINGHIKDYVPDSNNRFINFREYKIVGNPRDTAIQIDKNGDFHAVLYLPFKGNTSFYYSSGEGYVFKDIYVFPGNASTLAIDENKIKAQDYSDAFSTTGQFSATNKEIRDFTIAMNKHHFIASDSWLDPKLSSDSIVSYWNKRMKEELQFFHSYLVTKSNSDSVFTHWEENNIIYTIGWRIAVSLIAGRTDSTLTYQRYISYFRNIPINRADAIHNSAYYDFIGLFAESLEIIENINPAYKDEKKKNGNDQYPLALKHANQYTHGIARDLIYANLFDPRKLTQSTYGRDQYNKNVRDKFIQTVISKRAYEMTKPFEAYNVIEKLKAYKVDDSLKARLIDIFSKHKDKYLFVDFWGSWCAPCMQEIPVYPKFIAHFNSDSIRFLFLSYEMTQQGVDEVQKKYGIAADFILLTTNEMKILNNVLGFESYPHHFVIDRQGSVINNDMWSITPATNQARNQSRK